MFENDPETQIQVQPIHRFISPTVCEYNIETNCGIFYEKKKCKWDTCVYNSLEVKMIIVSYDISDDKLRTNFAKYLSKFGHRIQYSVFEIDNSIWILDNIISDLKNKYEKKFSQEDSVMIYKLSSSCEVLRFGYAKNDEKDFIIITWCKHGL